MSKHVGKFIVITLFTIFIGIFVYIEGWQYLNLDYLKASQLAFSNFYQENKWTTMGLYVVGYILVTSLSLPGAGIMTLAGGALFGVWVGTILASVSSTIGATVAFLTARYLLKDYVQSKFSKPLASINEGFEKEGGFYLFTLRLIPAFPFFLVNLTMGLTPIKTFKFTFVSQLAMLPGTVVFVNAGTQLSQITSSGDLLSPGIIGSFILLGIFPLASKKIIEMVKKRRGQR